MGGAHLNTLALDIVNDASRLIERALVRSVKDIAKGIVTCTYGDGITGLLRISHGNTN